eukprot:9960594-Karenia_brevis.AAC.1
MEIRGARAMASRVCAQTSLRTELKHEKDGKATGRDILPMTAGSRMMMVGNDTIKDHGKVLRTQVSGAKLAREEASHRGLE